MLKSTLLQLLLLGLPIAALLILPHLKDVNCTFFSVYLATTLLREVNRDVTVRGSPDHVLLPIGVVYVAAGGVLGVLVTKWDHYICI